MTLVSLDIFAPTDTNARVQNEKDSEVDFLVFRRQNKSLSKELLCSICAALKILHTFSLSVFHAPAHFYCFRSICRQNIFLLWDALCVYKKRACCDSFPLSRRETRFSSRTRALFSTYSLHQRLVHRLYLPLPERQTAATIGWCDIEYSSRAVGEWTSKENFADLCQREEHRRRAPPVHLWSISYMFTPLLIYYLAGDELWICHAWCLTSSSKNRFSLHPGARNTETRGKVFTVLSYPITSYG